MTKTFLQIHICHCSEHKCSISVPWAFFFIYPGAIFKGRNKINKFLYSHTENRPKRKERKVKQILSPVWKWDLIFWLQPSWEVFITEFPKPLTVCPHFWSYFCKEKPDRYGLRLTMGDTSEWTSERLGESLPRVEWHDQSTVALGGLLLITLQGMLYSLCNYF